MLTDGRTDDGRRTDAGRTPDAGVTGILIAHLGAFGSGELKIVICCSRDSGALRVKGQTGSKLYFMYLMYKGHLINNGIFLKMYTSLCNLNIKNVNIIYVI